MLLDRSSCPSLAWLFSLGLRAMCAMSHSLHKLGRLLRGEFVQMQAPLSKWRERGVMELWPLELFLAVCFQVVKL